jgi:2-methylcitrate dehydratase PrpD
MAVASRRLALVPSGRADRITSIEVATYKSAIDFCDKPDPKTTAEAKFSLQHSVAISLLRGLVGGKPTLADFAREHLQDVGVVGLRKCVTVVEDAEMTVQFPAHYAARVSVHFADGHVVSHEQADAWGDPELPMSDASVRAKAASLMLTALEHRHQAHLIGRAGAGGNPESQTEKSPDSRLRGHDENTAVNADTGGRIVDALIDATLALGRVQSVSAWTSLWPTLSSEAKI